MNKYLVILIGSLFLVPASNAADFCYIDDDRTIRLQLSLTGRCNGRGNDRFSSISGKLVYDQLHLPVIGSCISNRFGVKISFSVPSGGYGIHPLDFVLDGPSPRSKLNGVYQIAPYDQPGLPINFSQMNCRQVPQTSSFTAYSLPTSKNALTELPAYIQPAEE